MTDARRTPRPPSQPPLPQGNWLEDRDQAPLFDTTQRVTPESVSRHSAYSTSSASVGAFDAPAPRGAIPRRAMVTETVALAASLSRAPAPRPSEPPLGRDATTYARDFARVRADAAPNAAAGASRDPPRAVGGHWAASPLETNPAAFRVVEGTRRDFADDRSITTGFVAGGRSGARGPLTRHAEESGARDAPSVWADEFAHGR